MHQHPSQGNAIRLHAQWSTDGVRLWIGLDAPLLAQIEPIASQLQRWLAIEGIELLSLTFNGKPLRQERATPGPDLLVGRPALPAASAYFSGHLRHDLPEPFA